MTEKDKDLLQELHNASAVGRLAWQETAKKGEFTTSIEGRFIATVTRRLIEPKPGWQELNLDEITPEECVLFELRDLQDRLLLQIDSSQSPQVESLYDLARRSALHVDVAVEDALRLLRG